jgi:hypothetical protein
VSANQLAVRDANLRIGGCAVDSDQSSIHVMPSSGS